MIECKRLKYLDKSCRGFLEITMEGITELWLGYAGLTINVSYINIFKSNCVCGMFEPF